MLDPAILHSLEARMPPEPPAMVQERIALDPAGEEFFRIGTMMADRFEADAQAYIDAMAATQRKLNGSKPTSFGTPEEIARFAQAVASYEGVAELRAHNAARMQKRAERQAKFEAKLYPSVTVARRKILKRLLETDRRLIDAILDHALFIRALRSEIDPAAQEAPTFSEAADLRGYLAGLGAV